MKVKERIIKFVLCLIGVPLGYAILAIVLVIAVIICVPCIAMLPIIAIVSPDKVNIFSNDGKGSISFFNIGSNTKQSI